MLIQVPMLLLLLTVPGLRTSAANVESLVRDAAYNEAQAHARFNAYQYRLEKRSNGHLLTEEQIETREGPVHRMLAVDGKPLTAEQQAKEQDRIDKLRRDPSMQQKIKDHHASDEKRLEDLLALLPKAYLFHLKSEQGDFVTIAFQPNPQFHPDSYQARVMEALEGELVIDTREKRVAHLSGKLAREVKFGFGLLGHVDQGGVFDVGRTEVAPEVWRTTSIQIQVKGQFVFFATISKEEQETRSQFVKVPQDITVDQAYDLLARGK